MWIPVSERIPEFGQMVDVWKRGSGRIANCHCYARDALNREGVPLAQWNTWYGGYAGGATITHWMEIPEAPEGEDNLLRYRP